jgi:hypothetical protein
MSISTLTAFRNIAGAISVAAVAGCASTKLSEAWVDSSYTGGPLESVLVVGLSENVRRRGLFEEELTSRFNSRGVSALASMGVVASNESLDEESIKKKARELGMKSVIVTKLLSVDKEQYYVPGTPYTPYYGYGRGAYGYYDRAYIRDYNPGYLAEYEIVNLETNLYEVATDKLIWSAASQTIDPQSVEKVVQRLSGEIIDDLTKRGLLKP